MRKLNRRQFLGLVSDGAVAASISSFSGCVSELVKCKDVSAKRPNIIFIMADDLGYGHLGCYGQKLIRTPNIDKMATEGMRFAQHYAGSSVCAPSRCVLMTGLHGGHARVRDNAIRIKRAGLSKRVPLEPEDTTVAEVLKGAGYVTGIFGKWGLGEPDTTGVPNKQGFDEWFGYLNQRRAHRYYPEYLWHNGKKFALTGNIGGKDLQYSHDIIVEHAMEFIRSNRDRPFFCYLPVTIPHVELVVPGDSVRQYRGKFKEERIKDPRPDYISPKESFATFAGMISRLDDGVGKIIAMLKRLNIDENTIVFFTSDNGPQSGHWHRLYEMFNGSGPLRGAKGSLYEGGIRVPMIVRWPGKIRVGVLTDQVSYFCDFLPTAAELAGVEPTENIDGVSIVPTLLGYKQKNRNCLYWELRRYQALRMGDWKGIRRGKKGKLELYNLRIDMGETTDVADKYPELIARIKKYMETAHTPSRLFPLL